MQKTLILDTNVILHDPEAIFSFQENDIILPIVVLEELDKYKSEQSERGANAREFARIMERLREKGSFSSGIPLGKERGTLRVIAENAEFRFAGLSKSNDNQILGLTRKLANEFPSHLIILVTKDINLRLKADAFGIPAQDYIGEKADATKVGIIKDVSVSDEEIDALYRGGEINAPEGAVDGESVIVCNKTYDHLRMRCESRGLARIQDGKLKRVNGGKAPSGVKPKNAEQHLLVDALLDENVKMVVCAGVAGCGKTLLSMACGVELVEGGWYDKILITKSIQPVGNDIGYTKGTKDEKMYEWVKPFYDNLDFIIRGKGRKGPLLDEWIDDTIEVEAITYMRGRSIMHKVVIVDEVQNLPPKIVKTIVSRVADSSKLILLGDLEQIDNPYVDIRNNGLAHAMNRLSGLSDVAILNMRKSERGRLANLAVERL